MGLMSWLKGEEPKPKIKFCDCKTEDRMIAGYSYILYVPDNKGMFPFSTERHTICRECKKTHISSLYRYSCATKEEAAEEIAKLKEKGYLSSEDMSRRIDSYLYTKKHGDIDITA